MVLAERYKPGMTTSPADTPAVRFRPGHRRTRSYPTERSPLFSPDIVSGVAAEHDLAPLGVTDGSTQTSLPVMAGGGDGAEPVPYVMTEEDEKQLRTYQENVRQCWLRNPLRFLVRDPARREACGCRVWCVRDCLGVAGAVFTWILILVGEIVLVVFVIVPFKNRALAAVNAVFSLGCASLGFIAHVRSTFADPVSEGPLDRLNNSP